MTSENNWGVYAADGTEIARGMTEAQARNKAYDLAAANGREFYPARTVSASSTETDG